MAQSRFLKALGLVSAKGEACNVCGDSCVVRHERFGYYLCNDHLFMDKNIIWRHTVDRSALNFHLVARDRQGMAHHVASNTNRSNIENLLAYYETEHPDGTFKIIEAPGWNACQQRIAAYNGS